MSETIPDIQRAVCDHFQVARSDLLTVGRKKTLVLARQVAMYLCRTRTKHSYAEIAAHFGGRDHTTVMSAVNRISTRMEEDPYVVNHVVTIRLKLDRLPVGEVCTNCGKRPGMSGVKGCAACEKPETGNANEAGVMEYAILLSKDDAQFLIWLLFGRQAQRIEDINKKLDWVIETAERDEAEVYAAKHGDGPAGSAVAAEDSDDG